MKHQQSKYGQSNVKHAIWLKIFGIATVALVGVVSAMVFEFDPLPEPQVNSKSVPAQVASNASNKATYSPTGMQFAAVLNQTDDSKSAQQLSMAEVANFKNSGMHTASGTVPASVNPMPLDFVPNSSEGSNENDPFSRIHLNQMMNGQAAIDALGAELPAVAKWYGMSQQAFKTYMLGDATVHIDQKGRVLHIDGGTEVQAGALAAPVVHGFKSNLQAAPAAMLFSDLQQAAMTADADIVTASIASTSGAPFALADTFKLHTKSNSTRIIYLNFKGEGSIPAFDIDGTTGTFSITEQQMIQKIWLRVAEDYSAFDVDVTTELPTVTTGKTGVTILIANQVNTAGGYAYLNSFSRMRITPAPAFCFPKNLANSEKPIAECVSHEVGHTLGLNHQGNASTVYYGGVGDGETGWAPIMGLSYYKNLSQWAKGEFNGANNKTDAYAVMLKQGLSPRADDHGNARTTADPLTKTEANGLYNYSALGVIETPNDVDVFSFTAGAGALSLKVAPSNYSANLDVALELQDSTGKSLAVANPVDTLASTITVTLPASGTYYLFVKGTGKGDPASNGYSNYGSIGQYSITGTAQLNVVASVSTLPVVSLKASVVSGVAPLSVTFDGSGSSVQGSKITAYLMSYGTGDSIGRTATSTFTYKTAGTYQAMLKVTDARGQSVSKSVTITVKAK